MSPRKTMGTHQKDGNCADQKKHHTENGDEDDRKKVIVMHLAWMTIAGIEQARPLYFSIGWIFIDGPWTGKRRGNWMKTDQTCSICTAYDVRKAIKVKTKASKQRNPEAIVQKRSNFFSLITTVISYSSADRFEMMKKCKWYTYGRVW